MDIVAKCTGETFSLIWDDGLECFEGVDSFNYLVWVIHLEENDCPEVLHNRRRARQVCGAVMEVADRGFTEI